MEVITRKKYIDAEGSKFLKRDLESEVAYVHSNAHVSKRYFGIDSQTDNLEKYREIIRLVTHIDNHGKVKSPFNNLNDVEKSIIKRAAYRRVYKIDSRPDTTKNPAFITSVSYKENNYSFSPRLKKMIEFADLNIGEVFKVSLESYMDLPRYIKEEMVEYCKAKVIKDDAAAANLQNAINNR